MNFKIERMVGTEKELVLSLCGRIRSEELDTIRDSMAKETEKIALDLTEITLADRSAVSFLAKCELQGIQLRNPPAFLAKWIALERRQLAKGR
jgi:anti-anti-sigma regulatory factor